MNIVLRNVVVFFLLILSALCCKSPDSPLQTKASCQLSSYTYKGQSKINSLGGYTFSNQKHTYSYNEQGYYTGIYTLSEGSVTSSTGVITSSSNENKDVFELDKNGFIAKIIHEFIGTSSYGGTLTTISLRSITLYQYNTNGQVTQGDISYETLTGQKSKTTTQKNYTYDNNGKIITYIIKENTDQGTTIYSYYFTDGVLTKYTISNASQIIEPYKIDNQGRFIQFGPDSFPVDKLTYDARGNIIRDIADVSTTDYEYDNSQNPFLTIPTSKGFPTSIPVTGVNLMANANNITKRTIRRTGSFDNPEITTYDLIYNNQGLVISRIARDGTETHTYTYTGCN